MKFIKKCNELIMWYGDDYIKRKNGTLLLKPGKIPKAQHIIYAPLSKELIEEHLIKAYKNKMPEEYVNLLSHFNGMTLYMVKVNYNKKFTFASSRLNIFGLPLTPTSLRPEYGEEPIDVRMMDLERHVEISQSWLKVGCYRKDMNEDIQYDIFIDTNNNRVFCCKHRTAEIDEEWDSLDDCFCDIFDYLSTTEWEFDIQG